MSIFQAYRKKMLVEKLVRNAGEIKFLPRLSSEDPSLNSQPAKAALVRALGEHKHVVLEGAAGSGKTVLALAIALASDVIECAYLEASSWAPAPTDGLDEFLLASGCDHTKATDAYKQGKLALVLDAIDEAPWTTGGRSAADALTRISDEVANKAGLLVTSRTSRQVPELPTPTVLATLSGIDPGDVQDFLAFYAGSRTGASDIAQRLNEIPFPNQLRYSPLVLRRFAEGLSVKGVPSNIVELFVNIADFLIGRECGKPASGGHVLTAGSWQAAYADPGRHKDLVLSLVFGSGKSGRTISEPEFERLVRSILKPTAYGARMLVELSTLMSQHPLVVVTYIAAREGYDKYKVECLHDWARTALFPKFQMSDSLEAQVETLDIWQEAIPHHEDYVVAWSWLDKTGRLEESLDSLIELSSSPDQARTVSRWLAAQMLSPHVPKNAVDRLFNTVASLSYRFAPLTSDLSELLDLQTVVSGPLVLSGQTLRLNQPLQVANFGGLTFEQSSLTLAVEGPAFIRLNGCSFESFSLQVENACEIHLVSCNLADFQANLARGAKLILEHCLYDPRHCSFFPGTQVFGLDGCTPIKLGERAHFAWALAEVLRRLIVIGDRLELAKRKTNVNKHNIFNGIVSRYKDKAEKILTVMTSKGYVVEKPTGSIHRIDPTGKLDAHEAALFVANPNFEGSGPMTREILDALSH